MYVSLNIASNLELDYSLGFDLNAQNSLTLV